jgi:hypothetical protein
MYAKDCLVNSASVGQQKPMKVNSVGQDKDHV